VTSCATRHKSNIAKSNSTAPPVFFLEKIHRKVFSYRQIIFEEDAPAFFLKRCNDFKKDFHALGWVPPRKKKRIVTRTQR